MCTWAQCHMGHRKIGKWKTRTQGLLIYTCPGAFIKYFVARVASVSWCILQALMAVGSAQHCFTGDRVTALIIAFGTTYEALCPPTVLDGDMPVM